MKTVSIRYLFLVAAVFNGAVAWALVFQREMLFGLFRITPVPAQPLFPSLFAALVLVFGVGYYWTSRDPAANVPIIRLGLLGKISVVLTAGYSVLAGAVSWQLMILAGADAVFAVLFAHSLSALRQHGSGN